MSTRRTHRISGKSWSVETLEHGTLIDVLTAIIFIIWMVFAYGTIQQFGPSLALIGSVVVLGVISLLAIHGQYVTYIQFGNVTIGREPPHAKDRNDPPEQNR